jgi:large subunit ribosomal protein L13
MKTWNAKPGEIERRWYLVDAEGKTLGRLATQIADTLRGKTKPEYTPHVDTGDFVVVVNAEKIAVTGNKLDQKIYYRHSGYPGGLKERTLREQLDRRPTEVIRKAVKGMLPRNRLARQQIGSDRSSRRLDHDAQPHIGAMRHAFLRQGGRRCYELGAAPAQVVERGDHRQHNPQVAMNCRTQQCA